MPTVYELILRSTYKGGSPAAGLTEAHEKVEKHPFKTKRLLVRGKKIPKELYTDRLVQHYFIFSVLEDLLWRMKGCSELVPFFSMAFVEELKRTEAVRSDLEALGVDLRFLSRSRVNTATEKYLKHVEGIANPEVLFCHYATHLAGLMHGGQIIANRFFNPSDKLSGYKIPRAEYDFSLAKASAGLDESAGALRLFKRFEEACLSKIDVPNGLVQQALEEGALLYKSMAEIYDVMALDHPVVDSVKIKPDFGALLVLALLVAAVAVLVKAFGGDAEEIYDLSPSKTL